MSGTTEHTYPEPGIDRYLRKSAEVTVSFNRFIHGKKERDSAWSVAALGYYFKLRKLNRSLDALLTSIMQTLPVDKDNFPELKAIYARIKNVLQEAPPPELRERLPNFTRNELVKSMDLMEAVLSVLEQNLFVDLRSLGFSDEDIDTMRASFEGWEDWDDDEEDAYYPNYNPDR